jgi:hypothetical protein
MPRSGAGPNRAYPEIASSEKVSLVAGGYGMKDTGMKLRFYCISLYILISVTAITITNIRITNSDK